jgi:hypothetical protein
MAHYLRLKKLIPCAGCCGKLLDNSGKPVEMLCILVLFTPKSLKNCGQRNFLPKGSLREDDSRLKNKEIVVGA